MRKIIWIGAVTLGLIACNGPDLPQLLQYAQYGIDADCMFGKNALAADVCTFGGETIALAKAAAAKDPANQRAAVKAILVSAEARKPEIAPYLKWLSDGL